MKFTYIIFALIFLVFAAVQVNDPDPILWIAIYGYGAIVILLSLWGRKTRIFMWVGAAVYGLGTMYLFPSVLEWIEKEHGQNLMQRMVDSKMYIEETRECGGLIIASILMIISALLAKK